MDHILTVNTSADGTTGIDWYGLHKRLADYFGPRIAETGAPRWLFSMEPRTILGDERHPERFVLLRTSDPHLDELGMQIARQSVETTAPDNGAKVRFFVTVSGKDQKRREVQRSKFEPIWLIEEEKVTTRLPVAGLELHGEVSLGERVPFLINYKGSRFCVPGIRATGTAVVFDREKLAAVLHGGFGRERALGFGVLVVEEIV